MADPPSGIFFDELSKVRVLEPEISQQTQELKGECKEFVDSKFYSVEKEWEHFNPNLISFRTQTDRAGDVCEVAYICVFIYVGIYMRFSAPSVGITEIET